MTFTMKIESPQPLLGKSHFFINKNVAQPSWLTDISIEDG